MTNTANTPYLPPAARPGSFPWTADDARIAAREDEARRHADPRDDVADLAAAYAAADEFARSLS